MTRRRAMSLFVILLGAIAGTVVFDRYKGRTDATGAAPFVAVQSVSTTPVKVGPMVEEVRSYGNLVATRSVKIAPEAPGVVTALLFHDGEKVAAGAPLVQMDHTIALAQLDAARAQAETDLQNLRRTQSLSRQGLESTYTTEQAQSRAAASQANVQISDTKLSQLTLRAPFAGTLTSAQVDVGALVNMGQTIVTLEDTSKLDVEFRLPAAVAWRLTPDGPIHITVPDAPATSIPDGRLSFINPVISTDTRSILLRAEVDNVVAHVRPGLYVRVTVDLSVHQKALIVPTRAIGFSLAGSYVFIVDDKNIAHQRSVTVGLTNGDHSEILTGVKAGEQVVTVGQFRLRDGDTVKVIPPTPAKRTA
jgi:membrane fusion protein, multidrug efflux system